MKGRKTQQQRMAGLAPLTDEQRMLITRDMMAYADAWTTRFCRQGFCIDDLRQAAYLGLCIAATRYKTGASFKTFATYYIRKYLIMEMKTFIRKD